MWLVTVIIPTTAICAYAIKHNPIRGTEIEEPGEHATELDHKLYDKRMFSIVSLISLLLQRIMVIGHAVVYEL